MKKVAIILIVIIILSFFFALAVLAESGDDIQAIKRAVKKNKTYKPGQEVKWFKFLVTDNKTDKTKLRITLPVVLIEYLIDCTDTKKLKIDREECEVDLKELFQDLKKLGPMSVIEIYEDEVTLKVWFE